MREIKFKMWDKNNKCFLEDVGYINNFFISLDGKPFKAIDYGFGEGYGIIGIKKIEISQYTGLRDIAGDEIYEGDIVKDISNELIGYIEYSDGGFIIIYDDIAEKLNADESAYLEVIGNIFENPELLGEG